MLRTLALALSVGMILAGTARADPIEGNWRTDSGETASISGGSSFSIVLKTGKHAGRKIGTLKAASGGYVGEITDPANDKSYAGSATIEGSTLHMKGCLKLFNWPCRTQNWKRQ